MGDDLVAHPDACPSALEHEVLQLDQDVRDLFNGRAVPYSIQQRFFSGGLYKTMEDLADRWTDEATARSNSAADLGFVSYPLSWPSVFSMKIMQCVRDAKSHVSNRPHVTVLRREASGSLSLSNVKCDRAKLEQLCLVNEGFVPDKDDQCAQSTLNKQFANLQEGTVGVLPKKFVIPFYPQDRLGEKPKKVPASSTPGETNEMEVRASPTVKRGIDRYLTQYCNNLILCLQAFKHFSQFNCSAKDLQRHYKWMDDKVYSYIPDSQCHKILEGHDKMWELVDRRMQDGESLLDALCDLRKDTLWIVTDILSPKGSSKGTKDASGSWIAGKGRSRTPRGRGASRGGGAYRAAGRPTWTPKGGKPGGGKGAGRGRGKGGKPGGGKGAARGSGQGAGKGAGQGGSQGAQGQWPAYWAKADPSQVQFCRDYHLRGSCANGTNCPRSHKCPYLTMSGYICNSNHPPANCPLLGQ